MANQNFENPAIILF